MKGADNVDQAEPLAITAVSTAFSNAMTSRDTAAHYIDSAVRALSRALAGALVLCVWLSVGSAHAARVSDGNKQILVLVAYGYGRPGVDQFLNSYVTSLTRAGMGIDDIHVEFLDLNRRVDRENRQRRRDLLLHEYAHRRIDLIVAGQQAALNYLLDDLGDLAPTAPVLVIDATVPARALMGKHRFLEQKINADYAGTIDLALKVFPDTSHVLVVVGSGEQDKDVMTRIQRAADRWKGRLTFDYTNGLAVGDILDRASKTRPNTVILFGSFYQDGAGVSSIPFDAASKLARVANAPIVSAYEPGLHIGFLGGAIFGLDREGEEAARISLAIMNGTILLARSLTSRESRSVPMLEWRQIERWDGEASALPVGAVVLHRPPSLWEHHKQTVIITAGVIAVLLALIVVLQLENHRRKRAEIAARESEARLRAFVEQRKLFIRDILASATEGKLTMCFDSGDLPPGHPDADDGIPLDAAAGHRPLRERVKEVGAVAGLPLDRLYDLETAVGEAGMNAIVHAGGGRGYVRATDGGIQVWIDDQGHGIPVENLPQATLKRGYTTAGTFGHGMKMMLQTVDRVYLLTGPEGTTVVIEQDKTPPAPVLAGW